MKSVAYITAALLASVGTAQAAGDLSRDNPIEVVMEIGTDENGMFFKPDHFEFETGKAYKWVLKNVDEVKHELAIGEMFERIFTRKIEVVGADGNMLAEVKGAIQEVEIAGGGTVEWFFVPVQTQDMRPIACELEGHAEAGMVGTVTLK